MTRGSLAYRKHEQTIRDGIVPDKYARLLPFIRGRTILEIGAAEGVLSLLLADRDQQAQVTALELTAERHQAAIDLQKQWAALGRTVDRCVMLCGDITQRLDLLAGVETLVAIRTIYHLREGMLPVFLEAAAQGVSRIVLGGNPNRARKFSQHRDEPYNFYAGVEGMRAILSRAGYGIDRIVTEGDPIVVGTR